MRGIARSCRSTLDAIYQHPIAHGLEWSDVLALFEKIGSAEHKPNDETCFVINGERKLFRKPHTKDIPATTLIDIRHMLTRAGWSPDNAKRPTITDASAGPTTIAPDLLVVVEQHDARIYGLDLTSGEQHYQLVHSDLSPQTLHKLLRGDQLRDSSTGWASDPGYYERISQALQLSRSIVLVGHGKGHSNAAHNLKAYLQQHHEVIFGRLHSETDADLSSLTDAQRRALGRSLLTAPETSSADI